MLFTTTFFRVEVLRQFRNPYTLAFTLAMPVAMYLLFGANAEYASASAGNGNVAFYVMASMAAFGTATAMTSLCALAASEVGQGWGRQIALTPLSITGYAVVKLAVALAFSAFSTAIVFAVGVLTGARADSLWSWLVVAGIILAGGLMFGLFGLGVGLAFNSDSAASLASISITLFGFVGNLFMPLSGAMLDVARFTPMYGYGALVRWPITEGALVMGGGSEPLWVALANFAVWTLLFGLLVRYGVLRSRRRR
ncbi:ABC transporter [Leucobacter sp. G161]|uniref:ABC transporter n=1 Tax=Leucobacter sp. G161 TaxID=663704 RepID=UPI00073B590C|nr:ABC transporter [Leucobacter sp. G161]KUF07079.1 ABC transporter [Leucobacter sp. G161]